MTIQLDRGGLGRARVVLMVLSLLVLPRAALAEDLQYGIAVQDVKLVMDARGMHLSFTVRGIPDRDCEDTEVLLRLGRMELESDVGIITDLMDGYRPQKVLNWSRLRLSGDAVHDDAVERGPLEEAPIDGDPSVLYTERADRMFVRYRVPGLLKAGQDRRIAFALPFADKDPERPLLPGGVAIGCAVPDFPVADATRFAKEGLVGMVTLLRSLALEGDPVYRQRRLTALQKREQFVDELVALFESGLQAEAGAPDELAVAAALWLIPALSPARFRKLLLDTLIVDEPTRTRAVAWAERFQTRVGGLRSTDPMLWGLVMSYLVPRHGEADLLVRLFAMPAQRLPANEDAELLLALGKTPPGPALAVAQSVVRAAGAGLLKGIESWPQKTIDDVLSMLGAWHVAEALEPLIDEPIWVALNKRIGRNTMLAAAKAMTLHYMPELVLDALGAENAELRSFAYELVTAGRAPALYAVGERLAQAGYSPRGHTDERAYAADPSVLMRLTDRLQGILLASQAQDAVAEAAYLHARSGDCLAPLEAVRARLHPRLLLPEPLYSQCRALRAVDLLTAGRMDEADELMKLARRGAGGDPVVQARWRTVQLAHARRVLEAGDAEAANAIIDAVDPHRKHRPSVGLQADIETRRGHLAREGGDITAARKHFESARRLDPSRPSADAMLADPTAPARRVLFSLVAVLLLSGLGSWSLRRLRRSAALRDFTAVVDEDPARVAGPGSRELRIASHALLSLRSAGARLVAWAEVSAAYLIGGTGERAGLLIWYGSGEVFFVPMTFCDFDELLPMVRSELESVGVPLQLSNQDDLAQLAENEAAVRRLLGRDARAAFLQNVALAAGGLALAIVTVLDLGAGLALIGRLACGVGLGGGLALLLSALPHTLYPRGVA